MSGVFLTKSPNRLHLLATGFTTRKSKAVARRPERARTIASIQGLHAYVQGASLKAWGHGTFGPCCETLGAMCLHKRSALVSAQRSLT